MNPYLNLFFGSPWDVCLDGRIRSVWSVLINLRIHGTICVNSARNCV